METSINKKFYVPNISEFHVGFEYEQDYDHVMHVSERYEKVEGEFITKSTWSPKVFKAEDWEFLDHLVRTEFVRVKYLDQEDIESLGWIVEERTVGLIEFQLKGFPVIYLEFKYHSKNIKVINNGRCIFDGYLKNKSELKTLMQWLNITKE